MTQHAASVVIPARNAERVLGGQLAALSKQEFDGTFEVIVCDNGSTDGTAHVTRDWEDQFSSITTVDAGLRPGISYARNVGVSNATADYVLFCDSDDEAEPGWVQSMVNGLEQTDVVGGRLDLTALNPSHVLDWRVEPMPDGLPVTMGHLPYAVGANIGVRTSVYRALGGFDETYLSSHDEVEFCWRAQMASHTLGYAPDAVIRYRLRGELKMLWKQRMGYGRSYAQLYKQYRHLDIAPGQLTKEITTWLRLLGGIPSLATRRGRGRWVYSASWNAGRLLGSFENQALCPK